MDLRNLTTFVEVAELGSFSRAAEKLGYSQPTISVQIRQLEETLGVKLFDRIGHAVRLTAKGQDLLQYAQHMCHLFQEPYYLQPQRPQHLSLELHPSHAIHHLLEP